MTMISLETIQQYLANDLILVSVHAKSRCVQRGIKQRDIDNCILHGEIIEQYPDDYPFPSCLIYGHALDGSVMHVVLSDEGTCSRVITAYYPDTNTFEKDLRTRRVKQ